MSPLGERIGGMIEPSLAAQGYALVRVIVAGKRSSLVQIMAERTDGKPMSVDDCAAISRHVSALLDVEDPIEGSYMLEVSSPGIDRPLVKPADFARFAGHVARIETRQPIDSRKRFQGRLRGLDGETVKLDCDGREIALPYGAIERAKLVLTDDLIAASAPAPAGGGPT